MEHLEYLEILDLREKWEQEEIKDSEDLLGKTVCEVLLVYKEKRAGLVILVYLDLRVKEEMQEMLARWDHQEFKELQV